MELLNHANEFASNRWMTRSSTTALLLFDKWRYSVHTRFARRRKQGADLGIFLMAMAVRHKSLLKRLQRQKYVRVDFKRTNLGFLALQHESAGDGAEDVGRRNASEAQIALYRFQGK